MKQQILPLKKNVEKSFTNFCFGPNQMVKEALQNLTSTSHLYLWGESGCGLTHLLKATWRFWQIQQKICVYLDLKNCEWKNVLQQLENADIVLLDHLDVAVNNKAQEEILFHLFNRAVQTPFATVWAAHQPIEKLTCVLPDFHSRLSACLSLELKPLNDEEKQLILCTYAKQLGLVLNKATSNFLLHRYPRSLKEQIALLEALDKASLEFQKKLTIPFLKRIIRS